MLANGRLGTRTVGILQILAVILRNRHFDCLQVAGHLFADHIVQLFIDEETSIVKSETLSY